jgi:stage II sporulation protein M
MNKLIQYYRDLYIQNKSWLKGLGVLFAISVGIGVLAFIFYPNFIEKVLEGFQDRFGANPKLNVDLVLQIFVQNCLALGIALLGGVLLGLSSLLVVVVNGLIIGYIVSWLAYLTHPDILLTLELILGGLVPHGILEIPAFLIASALGLRVGWEWMFDKSAGRRLEVFKKNFKQAFAIVPVIIVVLFIAALIEVYVSGWIVSKL